MVDSGLVNTFWHVIRIFLVIEWSMVHAVAKNKKKRFVENSFVFWIDIWYSLQLLHLCQFYSCFCYFSSFKRFQWRGLTHDKNMIVVGGVCNCILNVIWICIWSNHFWSKRLTLINDIFLCLKYNTSTKSQLRQLSLWLWQKLWI